MGGLLVGNLLELAGLSGDNVRDLLKVVVDELMVAGVDERREEDDGGSDQRETPVGDNLDQPVREESTEADLRDNVRCDFLIDTKMDIEVGKLSGHTAREA
jgi:hypothetical protein